MHGQHDSWSEPKKHALGILREPSLPERQARSDRLYPLSQRADGRADVREMADVPRFEIVKVPGPRAAAASADRLGARVRQDRYSDPVRRRTDVGLLVSEAHALVICTRHGIGVRGRTD